MRHSGCQSIKVALTGGIGTGKSTVAKMMKLMKIPVFDADKEAHILLENNHQVRALVSHKCPQAVNKDYIDRLILTEHILKDISILNGLEEIMHPLIERKRKEFCNQHLGVPLVVFEIPLLFEIGLEKNYDLTVVTVCREEFQLQRVLSRSGMTLQKYKFFSERHLDLEEKKKRADIVIQTDYSRVETFRQIRLILLNKCK